MSLSLRHWQLSFLFLTAGSISNMHSLRFRQEKVLRIHMANREMKSHKTLVASPGLTEPQLNSSSKSKEEVLTCNFRDLPSSASLCISFLCLISCASSQM